jgi:2,5-diketo-D-gluconate reductase A
MTHQDHTLRLTDTVALPMIGFGTYLITDDDAASAVENAIRAGYRHIDTAEGYNNEVGVGRGVTAAMSNEGLAREEIFVTTKLWPGNADWGQTVKSREDTRAAFDASLARLDLGHVDLYLIHAPYGRALRLDQWRALLDIKASGKAGAVGVSNFNIEHLEEIRAAGLPMPDANQIELHPWTQKPDLIAYMRDHGIAPIAYSSLAPASSWRTDPGQDSAKTDDMRAEAPFRTLGEKYGVTEAQLLLRWGVQNGFAVLPKSLNPDRMRQNLDLFSFEIDADDMKAIRAMDRGQALAWAVGDPSQAS